MRAAPASRRTARGFTYLAVLFLVALTAAGLAALGTAWLQRAQREREAELAFRGGEIAAAIESYLRAGGGAAATYPKRWEDLLEDRRGAVTRHHLRRLYADPFTGLPDWEQLPPPAGAPDAAAFAGVRSRSNQSMLRTRTADGAPLERASDWIFVARAAGGPAAASSAPVAASAP
ncbi:type II secretion system protein [Roseateles sp. DC23W]|uniref:Type II secretion system protein n=1 Tax=Pelomonas dachongensis TaxID=3299029 RepID=A0ABW7EL92_9BURK